MELFQINASLFINDFFIPCILACILGGIIGYQREKSDRPAGLRTNILVCLGSTVFTLVSYLGFRGAVGQTGMDSVDVTRIAAGVVTGIGFIGAGVIFRQGPFLTGITTAATIWLVAAIGVSIGAKLYYLALLATFLGFLILSLLKYFEYKMAKSGIYRIEIIAGEEFTNFEILNKSLKEFCQNIIYERTQAYKIGLDGKNKFILDIKLESKIAGFPLKLIEIIRKIKGIESIEIK